MVMTGRDGTVRIDALRDVVAERRAGHEVERVVRLDAERRHADQRLWSIRQASVSCCTHSITRRRGGSHSRIVVTTIGCDHGDVMAAVQQLGKDG